MAEPEAYKEAGLTVTLLVRDALEHLDEEGFFDPENIVTGYLELVSPEWDVQHAMYALVMLLADRVARHVQRDFSSAAGRDLTKAELLELYGQFQRLLLQEMTDDG